MNNRSNIDKFIALPALAAAIWLILISNWQDTVAAFPVLGLSVVFHLAYRWLDLSTLYNGLLAKIPGSHGRFVTWAAVLLVGPLALWIDIIGAYIQIIYTTNGQSERKKDVWHVAEPVLSTLVRDTLVGLIVISLVNLWGGTIQINTANGSDLSSIMLLIGVRVAVDFVVMTAVFFLQCYGRYDSLFDRGQQLFRYGRALLFFLILPEPFAILGASAFEQLGIWGYLSYWIGVFLLAYFAHYLGKTAVSAQKRTQISYQLEQLAQDILREPAEEVDLPPLLAKYVPKIFNNGWVEIRQLPDTVLFAQAEGWIPAPNDVWAQLASSQREFMIIPGMTEAAEVGYGSEAMLIPVWQEDELVCGIYLLRQTSKDVRKWEAAGLALASQISASLQRRAQFQQALDSQAAAYEEAVYQQAYQAEVYAQALAYEKVSKELAVAGKIQSSFLPQELPTVVGWQLAVTLEPARETSGDFYDFIPLPNGRLGLIVADVADKGMGSALYMALSRTLIRTFATQFENEPEKALAAANKRILKDTTSDLFATVFYGILDPETGVLTYCNAGHNPPYLQSPNGENEKLLKRTALPIGIFEDVPWEQGQITINPGELLVMYTDGVVEAEDDVEDYFGESKLQTVTKANIDRSAEVIENKVITAVLDFVGDAPQLDDITLMLLKRESS
jgi:serine phosphatase RsbU (regulator of sigma subunit)